MFETNSRHTELLCCIVILVINEYVDGFVPNITLREYIITIHAIKFWFGSQIEGWLQTFKKLICFANLQKRGAIILSKNSSLQVLIILSFSPINKLQKYHIIWMIRNIYMYVYKCYSKIWWMMKFDRLGDLEWIAITSFQISKYGLCGQHDNRISIQLIKWIKLCSLWDR